VCSSSRALIHGEMVDWQWKVAEFKLGSAHKAALDDAAKHRQTLFDSFNTSVLAFSDFGGARLKKHKASPDAFAQVLCFQQFQVLVQVGV
jgi:Choline/Carnitine o-acyltransferase